MGVTTECTAVVTTAAIPKPSTKNAVQLLLPRLSLIARETGKRKRKRMMKLRPWVEAEETSTSRHIESCWDGLGRETACEAPLTETESRVSIGVFRGGRGWAMVSGREIGFGD